MFQTPRLRVPRVAGYPCGAVALADKPPVAHSLTVTDFDRQNSLGLTEDHLMPDFQALNRESLVQLTVKGRKSGKPHTVKIWFATNNDKVYVTSARGLDADWIKNLRKNPETTLQIGPTILKGAAVWREGSR